MDTHGSLSPLPYQIPSLDELWYGLAEQPFGSHAADDFLGSSLPSGNETEPGSAVATPVILVATQLPGSVVPTPVTLVPTQLPGSVIPMPVTPVPTQLPGSVVPTPVTTTATRLPGSVLSQPITLFDSSLASSRTSPLSVSSSSHTTDQNLTPGTAKLSTINVAYNGFTPAAQSAFEYAVDLYESLIQSPVPINVNAYWKPLGPGIIGSCGPSWIVRDFSAGQSNTWYPVALANRLAGRDLILNESDIELNLSSSFGWYLGTDANPGSNQIDLVSLVLHEMLHGLGTIGSMNVNNGIGNWGFGTGLPTIYDRFVENGAQQNLVNIETFANSSAALGNQLTSNNLFFDGSNAVAGSNGARPKLFAPGSWQGGSSVSHLDENTYPRGSSNSLNTPYFSSGEAIHSLGAITTGLLRDLGWSVGSSNSIFISPLSSNKGEGRIGSTPFTFTIKRTGSLAGSSTVKWNVAGTGVNPAGSSDFTGPTSGALTFSPNQATRTLTVSVIGDINQEANETFGVRLFAPTGATLGGAAAGGTIQNDDLIGNANPNTLRGTALAEFIDGRANIDTLTGGGNSDVFGFRFSQSPLSHPDRITDFAFGTDKIDLFSLSGGFLPAPANFTRASNNSRAASFAALTSAVFADANGAMAGNQALRANSAVLVQATNPSIVGTYLLINNATAGRSTTEDLLVNLRGFTCTLPSLGGIDPARVFI